MFPCSEDRVSFPVQPWHFMEPFYKDTHMNKGFHCLDMPSDPDGLVVVRAQQAVFGERTAPELLPSPTMQCANTVPSNQVAN